MTRATAFLLIGLLTLAACETAPRTNLGLGVGLGAGGVSIWPRVSTTVDGTTIGASPGAASVGTTVGAIGIGVGAGW